MRSGTSSELPFSLSRSAVWPIRAEGAELRQTTAISCVKPRPSGVCVQFSVQRNRSSLFLLQTFLRPGLTKVMLYRDRLLPEAEEDRRWQLYIHSHGLSPPLWFAFSPYFGLKEKKKKKRKTLFRIPSYVGPLLKTHLRTFPVSMRERKQFGLSFVPLWIQ